ncbi:MAG: hypothetical protein JHD28_03185 [Bacteroidia bacterium]|nr:hypothetical protein [Bacteroidia bacterium]
MHNIIKQKIDSINSLPPNYEPNLESKWELLEASLKPNKTKPFLFWFNRIGAAAAVLLLVGGIGMYGIKLIKSNGVKKPVVAQVKANFKRENLTQADKATSVKINTKAINKKQEKYTKVKSTKIIAEQVPFLVLKNEVIDTFSIPVSITENRVVETVKKQKRFTEIDFGETIITKPLEMKVANIQNFKFKVGTTFPNKTLTGTTADNSSFGFTKQIIPF